jgi:hypothetical protein
MKVRIATVRSELLSEHNGEDPPPENENCDGLTIVIVWSDLKATGGGTTTGAASSPDILSL